jgi:hypothetical protein
MGSDPPRLNTYSIRRNSSRHQMMHDRIVEDRSFGGAVGRNTSKWIIPIFEADFRGKVEMVGHSHTKERVNGEHKLRPEPARQSPTLPTSGRWRNSIARLT